MNDRTEFDDLARRKLEEREFPFDPQAWADMEHQLDAQDNGRAAAAKSRDRRWMLAALLLLATCGGVWYGVAHKSASEQKAAVVPASPQQPAPAVVSPANTPEEVLPEEAGTHAVTEAPSSPPETPALPKATTIETAEAHAPHHAPVVHGPLHVAQEKPGRPATHTISSPAKPATTIHPPDDKPIATPDDDTPSTMVADAPPMTTTPPAITQPAAPSSNDVAQDVGPDATPIDPEPYVPPTVTASAASDTMPSSTAITVADGTPTTPEPTTANDSTATGHPLTAQATDSTMHTTSDSLLPAPPAYPYWEVTAWTGLFNTSTRYSGTRTEGWATDQAGQRTTGFGAELMHMGSHFGIGTGLHFNTYAEQLDAEELSDSQTHLVYFHDLQSIDTSIMVVNGTVWIDGQQYYATYMQDTTFLVLVTTTGEETVTTVRRNALARSNRTSYLEIPLLLDAHTTAGRWGFGVRGGPMLGVLQGRRGVLPGATGYTDLADEAFQELVLGWTMQGYIRYRLGEAWSVGIGPAARGQLLNTMQDDDLVRRSAAWGGHFGVSYWWR